MEALAHNIVDGENTGPSPQLSPPPVLITSINNLDDVTAVERELSRSVGSKECNARTRVTNTDGVGFTGLTRSLEGGC
jgi:hypothetical protein